MSPGLEDDGRVLHPLMGEPLAAVRPRDTQRARLYRAEFEIDPGRRLPTVEKLQAYVDALTRADWFTARWPDRAFEVRPGFGHRKATADVNGVLQMPKWARSEMVLLHEVAHCLTPWTFAAHGPEYAGVLLSLVRRSMGPSPAQALEDAFDRQRVRCSGAALAVLPPAGPRRVRGGDQRIAQRDGDGT